VSDGRERAADGAHATLKAVSGVRIHEHRHRPAELHAIELAPVLEDVRQCVDQAA
jgi:hypothetical protein